MSCHEDIFCLLLMKLASPEHDGSRTGARLHAVGLVAVYTETDTDRHTDRDRQTKKEAEAD